jgi:hypothetical protein
VGWVRAVAKGRGQVINIIYAVVFVVIIVVEPLEAFV